MLKNQKPLMNFLIIIGLGGTFLFFPIMLSGRYTCFYHRIFNYDSPVAEVAAHPGPSSEMQNGSMRTPKTLLHSYIHSYALVWWASLLIVGLSVLAIRAKKPTIQSGIKSKLK